MEEVRWLDEDEQVIWRTFMVATRLLFDQFERDTSKDTGIPLAYYEILVRLSEAPDQSMRMSELADVSQASRSRLSHAASKMQALGWICRETCESDKRGSIAVLTDQGMEALRNAAPHHVNSVRSHLFDQLDDCELEQLKNISRKLVAHLAELGEVCPDLLVSLPKPTEV